MLSFLAIFKGAGFVTKLISLFKKNKSSFIFLAIIVVAYIVILVMTIRLKIKNKQISVLEQNIEILTITNQYLSSEVQTMSNRWYVQKSFSNTSIKIQLMTNDFYLTEEDIMLRENFKHDFYQ